MVLTRRARKCILRWLPNELVSEIIALSSSDTQRALCRVCKPFYQLAVISLYRAVDLGSYSKFARFAESLSSTPGNAIHVVSLRLHTTSRESEEDVAEFSVKCSLLNSLSRLKSLSISVSLGETICAGLLRDCTFPSLSDFRYIAPGSLKTTGMLTDEIVFSFIHRHREITRVVVMDASPRAPGSISREPNDSPLQNLRQFVGPDYLLDLLPPGITQIFLFSGDEEQTNALQRLSRLTAQGTDLNYSSIIILREPMARRLSLIARHLPRLVSLQLRWGTSPGRWLEPQSVEAISQSLGNFPALRFLSFHHIAFLGLLEDGNDLPVDEYTADREAVEKWGTSCPSLRECCFHGNGWRREDSETGASEWISSLDEEMKERPDLEFMVR